MKAVLALVLGLAASSASALTFIPAADGRHSFRAEGPECYDSKFGGTLVDCDEIDRIAREPVLRPRARPCAPVRDLDRMYCADRFLTPRYALNAPQPGSALDVSGLVIGASGASARSVRDTGGGIFVPGFGGGTGRSSSSASNGTGTAVGGESDVRPDLGGTGGGSAGNRDLRPNGIDTSDKPPLPQLTDSSDDLGTGSITDEAKVLPTPIPVPASAGLLMLPLAALMGLRRRRRA